MSKEAKGLPVAGHGLPNIEKQFGTHDVVSRVGAGLKKVGLPLIIPGGMKRFNDFHQMITPGQLKRPVGAGKAPLKKQTEGQRLARKEFAEKLRYWLPRDFCPDCNRTGRPHKGGAVNVCMVEHGDISIDLRPMELVITVWCQDCQMTALYSDSNIAKVRVNQGRNGKKSLSEDTQIAAAIRKERMETNYKAYIRAKLLAGDKSIYPNPDMVQVYGGRR